ncbi:hypothetical protein Tco_0889312 [Tanacetum coccineum]
MEPLFGPIQTYPFWEVIQNGNGPVSITIDTQGQIKVLPPRTAEEIVARERERKERTTLLMALPEDHLAKFHKSCLMQQEMWAAIKLDLLENDESKKMQKVYIEATVLKDSLYHTRRLHKRLLTLFILPHWIEAWNKIDEYDLEEMDLKWQVAMISIRMKKFFYKKTGHLARECRIKGNQDNRRRDEWNSGTNDGSRTRKKEDSKALVTIYGEGVDWTNHSEEDEDYALMACNSSESDTEREQLSDASIEIKAYTQGLKKVEAYLVAHQSLNHLIRDCDFHEKRMSRKAELNNGWNNVQRVNKQNQFVPSAVLTRTGKIPISTARTSSTKNVSTASGFLGLMTGNKVYLAEFQDFNGGPVAFGGSKGYITGKGKIKTGSVSDSLIYYKASDVSRFQFIETTKGDAEFTEIIVFLRACPFIMLSCTLLAKVAGNAVSILNASIRSDLLFADLRHLDAKEEVCIVPTFYFNLFDKIASVPVPLDHFPVNALTKRPSKAQPTPSPAHTSEVPFVPQTDSSPAHTIEVPIEPQTDPSPRPSPSTIIPDSILESFGGNLGDQAKEYKSDGSDQKAQESKLTVIKHTEQDANWGKFAKGEPLVHRDPLFDKIPEDTLDYIETENAQDMGRTRDIVGEEKEYDEDVLSTEDVLKDVSLSKLKVLMQRKGTDDHTEEGSANQTTQPPPTSTIFKDDETIAKVLLNMSQAKAVSREKEKGVELKDIEETDRPRPTSTRSLLTLKLSKIVQKTKERRNKRGDEIKVNLMADRIAEKRSRRRRGAKSKIPSCTIVAQKKIPCSTKIRSYQETDYLKESTKNHEDLA